MDVRSLIRLRAQVEPTSSSFSAPSLCIFCFDVHQKAVSVICGFSFFGNAALVKVDKPGLGEMTKDTAFTRYSLLTPTALLTRVAAALCRLCEPNYALPFQRNCFCSGVGVVRV